jgi:hypothetical protein
LLSAEVLQLLTSQPHLRLRHHSFSIMLRHLLLPLLLPLLLLLMLLMLLPLMLSLLLHPTIVSHSSRTCA